MSLKLGWKKMVLVQRKALKFTGLSRWGPNSFRSIWGLRSMRTRQIGGQKKEGVLAR